MPIKYTPRLSIDITEEQFMELNRLFDHGLRKIVFGVIVDEVIRLMKIDKSTFIAAIYYKKLTLDEILGMEKVSG
jgi:hypothetical protein